LPAHSDDQRSAPGDQAIDEALEETFPASDPPFWTPRSFVDGSRLNGFEKGAHPHCIVATNLV
jgi:hypothetical protein